jgi:hypothetical protein
MMYEMYFSIERSDETITVIVNRDTITVIVNRDTITVHGSRLSTLGLGELSISNWYLTLTLLDFFRDQAL